MDTHWFISLMEQSHPLPSLYSLAVWRREEFSSDQERCLLVKLASVFRKVFSAVPHDGRFLRAHTSLLENTEQSSIDKEKASQGISWGFALSWYLFHVMQWNFGHVLVGWTSTTISSFLQCCDWPRASSQCVFCTLLQLPGYCILSHNEQRVVL